MKCVEEKFVIREWLGNEMWKLEQLKHKKQSININYCEHKKQTLEPSIFDQTAIEQKVFINLVLKFVQKSAGHPVYKNFTSGVWFPFPIIVSTILQPSPLPFLPNSGGDA